MSNDYGWERFWCLRGETIHLDSKGFLSDPNSKYSPNDLLSNLLSTRSLSEARGHDDKPLSCLILLGEPGIGKTRELKRLHEEEKKLADDSGNLVLKYNLGNCTDAQELREKVFRSPVFRQWQSNENRLFLHLDSLDEGLLSLRRLSQLILAELKDEGVKPHLSRLFLRITCRSAIWSSNFEHGLVDLWGDQVTPYELAPLRRVDVEQAASENKIDPLMFLKEIAVKEVSALAIRPMTLNFLISSFERGQELPSEKHRIYYKGCQQLCKELNPDRRSSQQTGSLNEDQRLVVAGRIAAVMTFANRGSIYLGSGNPDKDDLTCSEIRGGKETVNGNDFEINDNELKETLDTGLFNARGDDRLGWAHQTYQEFLAAWYLQKHRLEKSQILSLITHHGDEEGKLVPQLHETSAWLASKNDDVFSEILKTDPNVLLNSDIETFGDEQKKQLINALFVAYEEKKLFDNWYEVKSYKKLNYDGITEQIKPYIFNKEKNKAVRSTAMDIARECMTPALENALVDVALNESEQVSFRALAAHIIANHASKDSKSKLTRLALDHISNDPDDEIKGSALKAVWPDHITTEELLGSLSPKRRGQHGVPWGSYGLFLNSDFEKHIPADDIDGALRWALDMFDNYGRGAENRFSFDWAISKVVYKGWEYLDRDGVLPLFARWAIRCIQNGVEITARLDEEKRKLEFQDDLKAHDNERHSLLKAIISELASYENQDSNEAQRSLGDLVEYYGIALVSDIPWLFDYSESAASKDEHNIALALITMLSYGLSTSTADPESREKVLKAATAKPGLAKLLGVGEVNAVILNSPEAEAARQNYLKYHKPTRQSDEDQKELEDPPKDQIIRLLDSFENSDVSAWWKLNYVMRFDKFGYSRTQKMILDFTKFIGWQEANEETKERIVSAAAKYLHEGETEEHPNRESFHRPSYAGLRSFVYFAKHRIDLLKTLPEHVWKRWASTIITTYPHFFILEEKSEVYNRLLKFSYENARQEVLNAVKALTKEENRRDTGFFTLHRFESIVDDTFVDTILSLFETIEAKPELISEFLEMMLPKHNRKVQKYARQLWQDRDLSDPTRRKVAVSVASKLLIHGSNEHWSVVFSEIQDEPEFAEEVIARLATHPEKEGFFNNLSESQKADLYIWLETHFPHKKDSQKKHTFALTAVTERDLLATLRNNTLTSLHDHGTYEACKQIQRIQEIQEGLERVLHSAKANTRRRTWQPVAPKYILDICKDREKRLVQGEEELMDVVLESLQNAEKHLHGETYPVQFLWNEHRQSKSKILRRPKLENSLSDWIAAWLRQDLKERGIITNREVDIRVGKELTDLHIDAVTPSTDNNAQDAISIIVEVKGSWNSGVGESMETQLIDRYLKDNQCKSGIYLVGWFRSDDNDPDFWDDTDNKKKQTQKLNLADAKAKFQEQAEKLSQGEVSVRSFVMDTALRLVREGKKKKE